MNDRLAVIDLGTNTFHLLIAEKTNGSSRVLFKESLPARLGKGGINKNEIQPDAFARGLNVLSEFRKHIDHFSVQEGQIFAFGTSALRNAQNGPDFCLEVAAQLNIPIRIVQGEEEAELIYYGVRKGIDLGEMPVLIVDIGGGSVEFIIGTQDRIIWKQSFEIGGQRMMEKFMRSDPMTPGERTRLFNYLEEQLIPLQNAVHQYAPGTLVGSSGTFDTLVDMQYQFEKGAWPPVHQTGFIYSKEEFYRIYPLLFSSNRDERLAIPGMIPLRAEMIVVAASLIDYLLLHFNLKEINVSKYALKEGVLARLGIL